MQWNANQIYINLEIVGENEYFFDRLFVARKTKEKSREKTRRKEKKTINEWN